VKETRSSPRDRGSAEREEGDEGDREAGAQRQGCVVCAAAARDSHGDGEDEHREHVVDDGCTEDRASRRGGHEPQLAEHGGGDPDARRNERGAGEDHHRGRLADAGCERSAAREREDDTEDPDEGGAAPDASDVVDPGLQPHPEEKEDRTELGENLEGLARLDPPEQRGPEEHAGQDLADERGLAEASEERLAQLGGEEDQEQVEERVRDARRCGDRHYRGRTRSRRAWQRAAIDSMPRYRSPSTTGSACSPECRKRSAACVSLSSPSSGSTCRACSATGRSRTVRARSSSAIGSSSTNAV
jgi:hypothetical protein